MAALTGFFTFLLANPYIILMLLTGFLSIVLMLYFIHNALDSFNAIHDIRAEYNSRSLSYLMMTLDNICTITYTRMSKSVTTSSLNSPYGIVDLHQQKLIYRYILKDIFLNQVYKIAKVFILENGYHEIRNDYLKFTMYLAEKGQYVYDYIFDQLIEETGDSIPDIAPHLGENFTGKEAIDFYTKIINNALENEDARDKKIKEYKKENGIMAKINIVARIIKYVKKVIL